MGTTLTNLSIAMNLNANGVKDGATLARDEIKSLQRVINESKNKVEKTSEKQALLEKGYKSGALSASQYAEALKRVNTQQRTVHDSASKMVGSIKAMVAAYVSFQGLRIGSRAIGESIERLDALSKEAKRLGESVNSLQKFTYAMDEMAGIDVGAAGAMLQDLSKKIGIAALGKGKDKQFLELLGLDAKTLSAQLPTKQFETVLEAIRKQGDATQKLALATKLFGDEGAKLIPLLNATNEEWEQSKAWVDKLGLSISDIDASKMEDVNDSLARAHKTIQGAVQTITVQLAPAIKAIADGFVSWSEKINESLDGLQRLGLKAGWAASIITFDFKGAAEYLEKINQPWDLGFSADSTAKGLEAAARRGKAFGENAAIALNTKVENPFKEIGKEYSNARKGGVEDLFPLASALSMSFATGITAAIKSLPDLKPTRMAQGNTLFDPNSQEYYQFKNQSKRDAEEKQLKEMQEQKRIWLGIGRTLDVAVERLTTIAQTRISRAR